MTVAPARKPKTPPPRKDVVARMMVALRCRRTMEGMCRTHNRPLYPTGDCQTAVRAVEAVIYEVAANAWDEGAFAHSRRLRVVNGHVPGNPYVFQT